MNQIDPQNYTERLHTFFGKRTLAQVVEQQGSISIKL